MSEYDFPHPSPSQTYGFSPVWTRLCCLRCAAWINFLPHPSSVQAKCTDLSPCAFAYVPPDNSSRYITCHILPRCERMASRPCAPVYAPLVPTLAWMIYHISPCHRQMASLPCGSAYDFIKCLPQPSASQANRLFLAGVRRRQVNEYFSESELSYHSWPQLPEDNLDRIKRIPFLQRQSPGQPRRFRPVNWYWCVVFCCCIAVFCLIAGWICVDEYDFLDFLFHLNYLCFKATTQNWLFYYLLDEIGMQVRYVFVFVSFDAPQNRTNIWFLRIFLFHCFSLNFVSKNHNKNTAICLLFLRFGNVIGHIVAGTRGGSGSGQYAKTSTTVFDRRCPPTRRSASHCRAARVITEQRTMVSPCIFEILRRTICECWAPD